MTETTKNSSQTIEFKAEVSKMLDIVIHSLYSNAEIFLRELISNASDACDKLRYALLLHPELATQTDGFKITLTPNAKEKTLTVTDNGIGMNEDDLINHLGTIARSGSAEFLKTLTGDRQKDMALIGQFGVGFYASFMVAEKVEVRTRKAGDDTGWMWVSNGETSFSITKDETAPTGTSVKLFLKKEEQEYLDPIRLKYLVRQYSDHISIPILLRTDAKEETVNSASALWTRNKAEITNEQYKDFYQSVSHAFDEPWMTLHYKAEGAIDYTGLLFIPTKQPFNLFQPDAKSAIQLYVNRVFISDNLPDLMPHFLRFVTGVIDTSDLPLNVSREMLQKTPVMAKIRTGLIRRILSELKKRSENKEDYKIFWENLGIVFKEGLYEPIEQRAEVAELCRFRSLNEPELIGFKEYVEKMKAGQKNIYYLTGNTVESLKSNPQLEGFAARGIDVLLLTDPIDEFWVQTFSEYDGKKIVSVMHTKDDLKDIKKEKDDKQQALDKNLMQELIAFTTKTLKDEIKEAKETDRLTKSPFSLITPEGQMSLHLERLMKAHGQATTFNSRRILEINTFHPLIHKLARLIHEKKETEKAENALRLLFDQTLIAEGEQVKDPAAFAQRLADIVSSSL